MKIEKFTKLKDNRYKILFDNTLSITLYDDVIVKYNLLVNKEMDDNKFNEITNYNDLLEAYYVSIKYIVRKMRSKKEIKEYLKKKYDDNIINITIEHLTKDGYLNEISYLKAYINDQLYLTLNGPDKIEKDLIKQGINEDEINKELNEINNNIWKERINKIIDKKIKSNHKLPLNKFKEKVIYDIVNLGYKRNIINEILDTKEIKIDDSLIYKEGDKIYNKLIKKYSDNDLLYQLKNKLYQKGFGGEEISNYMAKKNTD